MIRSAQRKVSTSAKTNSKLGRAVEQAAPLMEGLEGRRLMSATYLSDLTPTSSTNGWGPAEKDMSNGEQAAGDGKALTIAGKSYQKGLGVHAGSTLTYNLNGQYDQFKASVGVDGEVYGGGSVVFQAYLDGAKVYDSGTMVGKQAAKDVTLNTAGKKELKLVVTDAGNGNGMDHADWADAQLVPTPTTPTTTFVSDLTPTSSTNGWGPAEKDMSNGEQAAGDGKTLNVAGQTFAKGLGVHAGSTQVYNLNGQYNQFDASVGVDNEVGKGGSVAFQVFLDGVKAYDSGTMVGGQAAKTVSLNTTGAKEMKLVVTDAGVNGNGMDHADWGNARLTTGTGTSTDPTPTPTPTAPVAASGLTATAASTSAINLAWKDNSDNETGFKVERSTDGTNFTQVGLTGAGVTSFQDKGLNAGTKYYYRVRATNTTGDSAYTAVANATTQSATTNPTPTGTKPTATNTGPTNPSALKASGSITVNTPGAVIQDVNVNGTITVNASNVTIKNFKLTSGGNYGITIGANCTNVTIEDGEITGTHVAAIYGPGFTARRLNIHDTGADGIKPWSNVVIDSNYIHNLGRDAGSHADGIQESGGSNLTITNNNIDMPEYSSGGVTYLSNAAIFIHSYFGPVSNVKVDNNWLNGGNYTVYSIDGTTGYGSPTGVSFTNNKFGSDYKYGVRSTTGSVTWSGNTLQSNGASV